MNRRGFLKAFAGTSVAAVAAPMLLLEGLQAAPVAAAADSMMWWPLDDVAPAPAYKGTAYMVVTNEDLNPNWIQAPRYSFEVKA